MSKVIQLTDDIRIGKNLRGLVMRLHLIGFEVSQKNVKFSHSSNTLPGNQVYAVEIKGLSRFKKLTPEEIFYLDKSLKSGLSAIIIRKFLGFTLWTECIIGDF